LELSPDGRQLAFGSGDPPIEWYHFAAQRVLVMPASGGVAREVLTLDQDTEGYETYSFAWTRDGSHLLFAKRVAQPTIPSELWRVSAEGGEPESLGLVMWGRSGVRAHPDGQRITFTNQADRNTELWMMENFLPQPSGAR
jgi:Tol biopolymer transport system component